MDFSAYRNLRLTGIRGYPNAGIDRFSVLFYIVERYVLSNLKWSIYV
jgi:hypothetical protein